MLFLYNTSVNGAPIWSKQAKADLLLNLTTASGHGSHAPGRTVENLLLLVVGLLYQTPTHTLRTTTGQTACTGHTLTLPLQNRALWLSPSFKQGAYSLWEGIFRQSTFTAGHALAPRRGYSRRRRKTVAFYALPASSPLGRFRRVPTQPLWVRVFNYNSQICGPRLCPITGCTAAQSMDGGFFFPDSSPRHSKVASYGRLKQVRRRRRYFSLKQSSARQPFEGGRVLSSARSWGSALYSLCHRARGYPITAGGVLEHGAHRFYRGLRSRLGARRPLSYRRQFLSNRRRFFFMKPILKHRRRSTRRMRYTRFFKRRAHLHLRRFHLRWRRIRWNVNFTAKRRVLSPVVRMTGVGGVPDVPQGEFGKTYVSIGGRSIEKLGLYKEKPHTPHSSSLVDPHLLSLQLSTQRRLSRLLCPVDKIPLSLKPATFPFHKRQPQVRYKPGFMAYWRVHRRAFCKTFWVPFGQRQKRLTSYIARLRRIATFSYFRLLQLTLSKIVLNSHLIFRLSALQAWRLSISGAFAVNGVQAKNPLYQVYATDVIQYTQLTRLPDIATPMSRPWCCLYGTFKKRTPEARADTPAYVEVDELCSSIVLLFEPRLGVSSMSRQTNTPVPFLTLKCYNWKYVV